MHLAQYNVARLRRPLDDPRSAGFTDNLALVNAAAKRMPGFVWVLEDETGSATSFRIDNDAQMIINLSIWESAAHLSAFVLGRVHGHFLRQREAWFEAMREPCLVLWEVAEGARPTLEEAQARLAYLRAHGPSALAFGWGDALRAQASTAE